MKNWQKSGGHILWKIRRLGASISSEKDRPIVAVVVTQLYIGTSQYIYIIPSDSVNDRHAWVHTNGEFA